MKIKTTQCKHITSFISLNKCRGWLLGNKAFVFKNPIAFSIKIDYCFRACLQNSIMTETTLVYKKEVTTYLAFLYYVLLFLNCVMLEIIQYNLQLFVRKRPKALDGG